MASSGHNLRFREQG